MNICVFTVCHRHPQSTSLEFYIKDEDLHTLSAAERSENFNRLSAARKQYYADKASLSLKQYQEVTCCKLSTPPHCTRTPFFHLPDVQSALYTFQCLTRYVPHSTLCASLRTCSV